MFDLTAFPMGPKLRTFFGVDKNQYSGAHATAPTPEQCAQFEELLHQTVATTGFEHEDQLVDILDELVAMNLPRSVLALREAGDEVWSGTNFRGELATGVAAMLAGDLERAEQAFIRAQELMPNEPAPYVNLAVINLHGKELEGARTWAEAGLEAEPNNWRLWDVFAQVLCDELGDEAAAPRIKEFATAKNSWAGWSLVADMQAGGDTNLKAEFLRPFYDGGERHGEFLVEYTAALGMAGTFEAIPQILWDAKQRHKEAVSWQLVMHAAQAHLAQEQTEPALKLLDEIDGMQSVPHEARGAVQALREEAKSI